LKLIESQGFQIYVCATPLNLTNSSKLVPICNSKFLVN
jgi:hypothetical protein